MDIMLQPIILEFSKTNNLTQKEPLSSKKSRIYIRRPQIKKFYNTDPPKSGNSDAKYNLKIFKN